MRRYKIRYTIAYGVYFLCENRSMIDFLMENGEVHNLVQHRSQRLFPILKSTNDRFFLPSGERFYYMANSESDYW